MKHSYHYIKDAYTLIKRKKYSDAVVVLDRIIHSTVDEPYPLFLKAMACLYLDKFNEANIVLSKIAVIEPAYPPYVQLKTFLELKSAPRSESALNSYLDVLEKFPDDEYLQKARRELSYATDFKKFQKNARLNDFVDIPKPPRHLLQQEKENYILQKKKLQDTAHARRINKKKPASAKKRGMRSSGKPFLFKTLFVLGFIGLFTVGIIFFFKKIQNRQPVKQLSAKEYARIDKVYIGGSDYNLVNKINKTKTPIMYYSTRQVKHEFYAAKKLIKKGQYNQALLKLNRINNSNVNLIVKEKVDFLVDFVMHVQDRNYEPISYAAINKRPYLYRGYGIKLKGKVTNLKAKLKSMTFTLLIDYKKSDVFSGIADVYINEHVKLENGSLIELEGLYISPIGNNKRGYIAAKSIKQL